MDVENDADAAFAEVARVARVLGNGSRVRIVQHLAQGERSVQQLAERVGLNLTTASAHLHALRDVGLVSSRRSGKQVFYQLAGDDVAELVGVLVRVAEHRHLAAREVLAARDARVVEEWVDELTLMSRTELMAAVQKGSAFVVDVRPADEYASGHLRGATSLPLEELVNRLDEIPADQEIVAYCRGRACALSRRAAAQLVALGYRASAVCDGIVEWRADGVELERSSTIST